MDTSQMSEKDLKAARSAIDAQLKEISDKKAAEKKLRLEYHLEPYVPTYQIDLHSAFKAVEKWFQQNESLTGKQYDELMNQSKVRLSVPYESIYRCPKCGQLTLYLSHEFNDNDSPRYRVTCNICGFEGKLDSYPVTAWEEFHMWLIRKKFLPEGTEFIH